MSLSHPIQPDAQDSGFGFTVPRPFPLAVLRSALEYKPRPQDIFVATYPKCGTTWVQTIVCLILREGRPLDTSLEFFLESPFLELTGKEGLERRRGLGAIKTHLPFRLTPWSPDAKYIYVARNPKDCCVSFYYQMRNLSFCKFEDGSFDDFFELFLEGRVNFGDYFDHLLSWYERKNDPNVLFVTYEQLKKETKTQVLKIAGFMGQQHQDLLEKNPSLLDDIVEYSSFRYMKAHLDRQVCEQSSGASLPRGLRDVFCGHVPPQIPDSFTFVRKGVVGDWKNYFSEEQSRRLDAKFLERTRGTDIPLLWEDIL